MFSFSSIEDYVTALQNGETTCESVVSHYLSVIESKKHLNAFLEVFTDEAAERARQLDEDRKNGKPLGKLHGVVVGLKDVIAYKGHKLSASSRILEGFTSIYNATAVDRLLQEGAIIIGRQNCDEFAMGSSNENSAYGNVLNAADNKRVPGGSSGGSAVAVQAGMCMVSLGSDTGGSVRQPADFCGIVGLKPTYGRVSRYGLIAYASSFDQIGIFATNVADAALTLEVIAGEDAYDSTQTPDAHIVPWMTWNYDDNYTGWSSLLVDDLGTDRVSPLSAPARLDDFTGLAPAFIDVGELDIFRDEGVRYAGELWRAGVSAELHVRPGVPHGYYQMVESTPLGMGAWNDQWRILGDL